MYQLHILAGKAHYIRLTETYPRQRQIDRYESLGADVWVEEVEPEQVDDRAVLRRIVRIE